MSQRQRRGEELKNEEKDEIKEWRINGIKKGKKIDYLLSNRWIYGEIYKVCICDDGNGGKHRLLFIEPQMDGMYPSRKYYQEFFISRVLARG